MNQGAGCAAGEPGALTTSLVPPRRQSTTATRGGHGPAREVARHGVAEARPHERVAGAAAGLGAERARDGREAQERSRRAMSRRGGRAGEKRSW